MPEEQIKTTLDLQNKEFVEAQKEAKEETHGFVAAAKKQVEALGDLIEKAPETKAAVIELASAISGLAADTELSGPKILGVADSVLNLGKALIPLPQVQLGIDVLQKGVGLLKDNWAMIKKTWDDISGNTQAAEALQKVTDKLKAQADEAERVAKATDQTVANMLKMKPSAESVSAAKEAEEAMSGQAGVDLKGTLADYFHKDHPEPAGMTDEQKAEYHKTHDRHAYAGFGGGVTNLGLSDEDARNLETMEKNYRIENRQKQVGLAYVKAKKLMAAAIEEGEKGDDARKELRNITRWADGAVPDVIGTLRWNKRAEELTKQGEEGEQDLKDRMGRDFYADQAKAAADKAKADDNKADLDYQKKVRETRQFSNRAAQAFDQRDQQSANAGANADRDHQRTMQRLLNESNRIVALSARGLVDQGAAAAQLAQISSQVDWLIAQQRQNRNELQKHGQQLNNKSNQINGGG